jgi:signal transduction histidine kinase
MLSALIFAEQTTMARLSIQKKLPLLMSGFLILVIALYSVASYRAVQAASIDVARQRLVALAAELAQLFDQSVKNEAKAMRTLAEEKTVRDFVKSPGAASRAAAIETLRKTGTRPELTMRAEILDAQGAATASIQPGAMERHEELSAEIAKAAVGPDFAAVGRLRLINDTLVIPSVAAVVEDNRPVGFVVRWRRVAATTQARDQLAGLLGTNASLYLGNDRGDVWTDFVTTAAKPPVSVDIAPGQIRQYTRPGAAPVVATTHAVAGAPWVVLVEFSRQAVMAPAAAFLQRSLLIGLLVVLAGTLVVWFVSRSITKPLAQLTGAATSLAGGDYSTVVESGREDELGELSRAFNAMVGQVQVAQQGLEEKVRNRTEQLHERNEELETFAHSISHDLRAPLRAMHGFSQALLEDCGPQLDDTGKDYAQRIVAASRRMDSLIQDLLAYSRISRADVELTNVQLGDVTQEALTQLEADANSSGATIRVPSSMPAVLGHRVTLVQAVANLFANGMKFVPPGRRPEILVRAEYVNGKTKLWIEDNGIGIDPAHHERVFGVFERLHQSENYPGTGIGLAIVRKSIERMGGRVGVESAVGRGSRFWIELTSAGATS